MYLLFHKRSKPTGEIVAKALQIAGVEDIHASGELLIRWGSRWNPQIDNYFGKVLNSAGAIRNASDKILSLELMDEAGVNVPDWDEDPGALVERVGYPILGRKRFHARGLDIKLCLQRRDYRKRKDYYVQYIPTVREYRIHVVGDEVVRVQGKFLDHPEHWQPHIRNFTTGFRFRKPNKRLRPGRLETAVRAVQALGLDFGAVDLLIGDDGLEYVLEVNTAPSCSPLTAAQYVVALSKMTGFNHELDLGVLDLLNPEAEEQDSDDEIEEEDYE